MLLPPESRTISTRSMGSGMGFVGRNGAEFQDPVVIGSIRTVQRMTRTFPHASPLALRTHNPPRKDAAGSTPTRPTIRCSSRFRTFRPNLSHSCRTRVSMPPCFPEARVSPVDILKFAANNRDWSGGSRLLSREGRFLLPACGVTRRRDCRRDCRRVQQETSTTLQIPHRAHSPR